jgi:hypothetical protein
MTLSEVEGVFKNYQGTLDFDVSEQRLSKINAFILVDSIDTQDKKRDAHLKKGDFFTEKNLTVKRPGNGISPYKWDEIIGKEAKRDYNLDDLIEW